VNPIPLVAAVLVGAYGLVNLVFTFVPAPPGLARVLGPDRRTRGLLFFVPDAALERVGRFVYGLVTLALASGMGWLALG
jgi:hypothetical protein